MRAILATAAFALSVAAISSTALAQSPEPGLFAGLLCNTKQQAEDAFLSSMKHVGGPQGQLQAINELNEANNGPVCIVVMQMQLDVLMRKIDALAHGGSLYDVVEVSIRGAVIPAFPGAIHMNLDAPIVKYSVMSFGYKGAKL